MNRLLQAMASPYSAKVRMGAAHTGFEMELVPVQTGDRPAELVETNPLVKIPVLITSAGQAVYDSRAIMRYIDRVTGGALFPREPGLLTRCEVREALADGICDAMLLHVYERRYRPAEIVHQPWLDKQWSKVRQGFIRLAGSLGEFGDRIDAGDIGVRSAVGYFDLRFEDAHSDMPDSLREWSRAFDLSNPRLASFLPQ